MHVCIGIILLIATVFVSCQKDDLISGTPSIKAIDESDWNKDGDVQAAFKAFADAKRDFFDGIPSAMDNLKKKPRTVKEILDTLTLPKGVTRAQAFKTAVILPDTITRELDPKNAGIKENIVGLAWEATYTKDNSKLISYLEETGLYDKYLKVCKKYNIEQHAKNLSLRKKSTNVSKFQSSQYIDGDIFVKYDISSSGSVTFLGLLCPGKWTHSAFLDAQKRNLDPNNHYLLSASDDNDQGGACVGYDRVDGYWTAAAEVCVDRVKGATAAQRRGAIVYAKQFIGNSFMFIPYNRGANYFYYCSKLVYRGWFSQGYELEPHYDDFTGLPWIPYLEFVGWSDTWIPYPEFRWEAIPDMYVTSSNLHDDDNVERNISQYPPTPPNPIPQ